VGRSWEITSLVEAFQAASMRPLSEKGGTKKRTHSQGGFLHGRKHIPIWHWVWDGEDQKVEHPITPSQSSLRGRQRDTQDSGGRRRNTARAPGASLSGAGLPSCIGTEFGRGKKFDSGKIGAENIKKKEKESEEQKTEVQSSTLQRRTRGNSQERAGGGNTESLLAFRPWRTKAFKVAGG